MNCAVVIAIDHNPWAALFLILPQTQSYMCDTNFIGLVVTSTRLRPRWGFNAWVVSGHRNHGQDPCRRPAGLTGWAR